MKLIVLTVLAMIAISWAFKEENESPKQNLMDVISGQSDLQLKDGEDSVGCHRRYGCRCSACRCGCKGRSGRVYAGATITVVKRGCRRQLYGHFWVRRPCGRYVRFTSRVWLRNGCNSLYICNRCRRYCFRVNLRLHWYRHWWCWRGRAYGSIKLVRPYHVHLGNFKLRVPRMEKTCAINASEEPASDDENVEEFDQNDNEMDEMNEMDEESVGDMDDSTEEEDDVNEDEQNLPEDDDSLEDEEF